MKFPPDLRYTRNDEWIRVEGESGAVGLTDYAQDQLSDIVYVDYSAAPGSKVTKGNGFATVESVKAAADVYMPVDGEVVEVNKALQQKPDTINSDPYGAAWLVKVKVLDASQLDGLLDAAAYEKFCQERQA
ncbi:MAG TPA: glycine cleavage system protein GcvH [Anaerolineales bacterium]